MSISLALSAVCDSCLCALVTDLATLSVGAPDVTSLWNLGIQQGWRFKFLPGHHRLTLRCLCSDCSAAEK